jgi:predicted NAD-dependent protein-ADP-ribosyltransferase YbiA (DUF1768 family)
MWTGARVNMDNGETVTNSMFAIRKSKGDLSLKDVFGYQKVKYADGSPLIIYNEKGEGSHVYKMVNLYGDGQLVSEYYENNIPSVLDNGTVKIANEITDEEIIAHYGGQTQPKVVPLQPMATTQPNVDSSEKINIYAGTGENSELSNFAVRPFVSSIVFDDATYQTVEGAFQAAKLNYVKEGVSNPEILGQLQKASGAEARSLGRSIKGLDTKAWDANSSRIMKELLKASFEQNPAALEKLLATGNATLTHKYKDVEQDKGRFSRLLMEVREELNGALKGETTTNKIAPEGLPEIDNNNKNNCG